MLRAPAPHSIELLGQRRYEGLSEYARVIASRPLVEPRLCAASCAMVYSTGDGDQASDSSS
jgi:hypothetical protein